MFAKDFKENSDVSELRNIQLKTNYNRDEDDEYESLDNWRNHTKVIVGYSLIVRFNDDSFIEFHYEDYKYAKNDLSRIKNMWKEYYNKLKREKL